MAHKVIIGSVNEDNEQVVTNIKVIDIKTSTVQLEKKYEDDVSGIEISVPDITREITFSMLDIEEEPEKEEILPYNPMPWFSLSSGFLSATGKVSNYLATSYLVTLQVDVDAPYVPWAKLHLNIGFSSLDGEGIDGGSASLTFMPIIVSASRMFTVSRNPLIPKPVVALGLGLTYLSLEKSQYGHSVSEQGFNPTIMAGLGLWHSPYKDIFVQLETRFHYIFEDLSTAYMYGGIRVGKFFDITL